MIVNQKQNKSQQEIYLVKYFEENDRRLSINKELGESIILYEQN